MEVYSILSHEFRRHILEIIEKEGYIQYTDLMDKLGLDSTGQLNFHLKKLGHLVDKDNKNYFLTEDGKRVLKIIKLNKRILAGEDLEYLDMKGSEMSRVGVIICNCNTEISQVINIFSLENYVSKLNNVVSVKIFENLCQEKNLDKINSWVQDNFINKVVIAACSPKTHQHIFERVFQDLIDNANIEIANIREQCCWVHQSKEKHLDPYLALNKAQLLVEAAVKRVSLQKEIKVKRVEVEKSCAIIGGGIAGMNLALKLSRAGIYVYLIEKSPTLGGKVARWHRIHNMGDCSICFISELIGEIVKQKNIEIHTNTEVTNVFGEVGNFTLEMYKTPRYIEEKRCTGCKQCIEVCAREKPDQYEFELKNRSIIYLPFQNCYPYVPVIDEEDIEKCRECNICVRSCMNKAINLDQKPETFRIKAGVKVIAIGGDLYQDLEKFHYNPEKNIISSPEFERILSADGPTEGNIVKWSDKSTPPKSVAIIQNIGPDKYECDFMHKVALKYLNCLEVKTACESRVFYKLDTHLSNNEMLLKTGDPRFIYANNIEIIENEDTNIIKADNQDYESDLIVLNTTLVPNHDLKKLRKKMDFTLDDNGFMSRETLASGIYGVGSIFGPLDYHSTLSTTNEVALDILSVLSQDYLFAEFSGIEVNQDKCGLCGLCKASCPYNAITIEGDKIQIDKFKCKGCGTCVSVCPTHAIEMNIDTTDKIIETMKIFSKFKADPKILAFCCQSCGYAAADDAGLKKLFYSPNVFIIRVPCTGRVDSEFILKAFELGFNGIMIIGCRKDACRYIDGVQKAQRKVFLLKSVLGPGLGRRIIIENLNAVEGKKFTTMVNRFYNILSEEVINET